MNVTAIKVLGVRLLSLTLIAVLFSSCAHSPRPTLAEASSSKQLAKDPAAHKGDDDEDVEERASESVITTQEKAEMEREESKSGASLAAKRVNEIEILTI